MMGVPEGGDCFDCGCGDDDEEQEIAPHGENPELIDEGDVR